MRLGLFMMPLHPPDRPMYETYEEDLAKIVFADEIGFDEVWVGEHFSASTEPVVSPLIFLAAAMARTNRIKLGSGVVNLPNHNPIIVAAEVAQLDHMSKGRFLFGIGPGGLASDFEVFGNEDPKLREERMLEAYEAIRYIWANRPPYNFKGKHYSVSLTKNIIPDLGIGFMPQPYQKPGPEVGLSIASPFSSSAKRAALKQWSPISANFAAQYVVASHWTKFQEGCAEAGIAADGRRWRVSRNIVIGDSDAEAEDLAHSREGGTYYYFSNIWRALSASGATVVMKQAPNLSDDQIELDDLIRQVVIYGSLKTVIEKLEAFRSAVGPFGTLILAALDRGAGDGTAERKTMKMLKHDVVPRLAGAVEHV